MSNVLKLEGGEKKTMNAQLDYYEQEMEEVRVKIGELWTKLEAIELITKGIRGMM
jgi:hypothetical protein